MQYCRIISLDNNNSVKFTSSRGDNSTTNVSMVMKIAHAQFHMYTNIMYKFQSSMCKTVGEKLRRKLCPQTNGQTDRQPWRFQYTPLHFVVGGIITKQINPLPNHKILDMTKLKAFADDNLNVAKMMISLLHRVKNTVGKGENAGNQHFLLFQQCFPKHYSLGLLKVGIVW